LALPSPYKVCFIFLKKNTRTFSLLIKGAQMLYCFHQTNGVF